MNELQCGPADTDRASEGAADEYQRRLDARRAAAARDAGRERQVADARLILFLAAAAALGLSLYGPRFHWGWVGVPAALFAALVVYHDRLRRRAAHNNRAVAFYENGLKRLDGTWPGTGVAGERFLDLEHPYAADLDLFGPGSLFERLCTARTRAGEETLANWLLGPADPPTIRLRQAAVAELRPRLDLREDLELFGADVRAGIDTEALSAWGRSPRVFEGQGVRIAAVALAALGVAALAAWASTEFGRIPFVLMVMIDVGFYVLLKRRLDLVLAPLRRRTHDLVLFAGLLERVEREPLESPRLVALRAALQTRGEPASRRVARLARLAAMLDARENQAFAPIAALLMWAPLLALAIEDWRARTGPEIAGWLDAVGEFEALSSIAGYAFENPSDPFPEIVEGETVFAGSGLGHPLIPTSTCVRNDVTLGDPLKVLLVSGSNMSGKSTLLRSVGANAVFALAGAPVRAATLRTSVLALGATLRVQDSLQAGRSRFYAELTRVRQLVAISRGPCPLLFLLDEIFHGTNSHDRVVGAGSLVRGLLQHGAVGLVTTHDLALAAFADDLGAEAANVHFEDQLVDGQMTFDFRMRPGVVRHSNALALMRAVGLDV